MSRFDGHWSQNLEHKEWEVVIVTVSPDSNSPKTGSNPQSRLILPYDRLGLKDGPWIRVVHTFTPTWRGAGACAEVIVGAFGYAREPVLSRKLLSYRVRIHPNWRLELVKQACVQTTDVPWDPYCIVNSGLMFELLDRKVTGFNLFPNPGAGDTSEFVCKSFGIGWDLEEKEPEERVPMACVADPYSGTVAISTPELVRVFRFD